MLISIKYHCFNAVCGQQKSMWPTERPPIAIPTTSPDKINADCYSIKYLCIRSQLKLTCNVHIVPQQCDSVLPNFHWCIFHLPVLIAVWLDTGVCNTRWTCNNHTSNKHAQSLTENICTYIRFAQLAYTFQTLVISLSANLSWFWKQCAYFIKNTNKCNQFVMCIFNMFYPFQITI